MHVFPIKSVHVVSQLLGTCALLVHTCKFGQNDCLLQIVAMNVTVFLDTIYNISQHVRCLLLEAITLLCQHFNFLVKLVLDLPRTN